MEFCYSSPAILRHQPIIRDVPGAQTAVLFVHGILGTPDHFTFLMEAIPADWSVRNLLLVGHGGGVCDFSRASMDQWKRQVASAVDELCQMHERLYIVAHSMGTLFAIDAARCHPRRIAGLFLLAAPLRLAPKPRILLNCLKIAFDRVPPDDLWTNQARAAYGLDADPRLWRYLGWIPRYLELFAEIRRVRKQLPGLAAPTLVFPSAHDELLSQRAAACFDSLPCARVEILPNSGHYGYPPQDAQHLLSALHAFLRA